MSEFLSAEELQQLTLKARGAEQAAELERLGVPYRLNGKRRPIVSREHVRAWLAGTAPVAHTAPRLDLVR